MKKKITRENEDIAIAAGVADEEDKDAQYGRIRYVMDRLLKILESHTLAVDNLEKKLNLIESSKKKFKGSRSKGGSEGTFDQRKRTVEDEMFNTGEIEGFDGRVVDDLEFIDKEELENDKFMDDLNPNQGYEPSSEILAPYRMPIENQKLLNINSDRESLKEISSDDSDQEQQMSDDSGAKSDK